MPEKIITTLDMNEKQLINWRKRAKRGDAYELEGAYGDLVYLPKIRSDVDPLGARIKTGLELQKLKRHIDFFKKRGETVRLGYADIG